MAKGKRGRPSKLIPENVKKLEEAFAFDSTIEEACYYAGISMKTYHNWVNENPELLHRFKELRNRPVLLARQKVVKELETDTKNAQWYLERKRKGEFSERKEVVGDMGITVTEGESAKLWKKFNEYQDRHTRKNETDQDEATD